VVVHRDLYAPDRAGEILTQLVEDRSVAELGHFGDGYGTAVVFKLR
jgi:hypothetical protein